MSILELFLVGRHWNWSCLDRGKNTAFKSSWCWIFYRSWLWYWLQSRGCKTCERTVSKWI